MSKFSNRTDVHDNMKISKSNLKDTFPEVSPWCW